MIASTFFIAHACGDRVLAGVKSPHDHPKSPAGAEPVKGGRLRRRPPVDVPDAARLRSVTGSARSTGHCPDAVNDSGTHPAEPDRRPLAPGADAATEGPGWCT